MIPSDNAIVDHYTTGHLGAKILSALDAAGKDLEALTVNDLAAVDAFHIRGRAATEELADWTSIHLDDTVLDVGCGLGGTCRYLAATTGCRTLGIDLTDEYFQVAEILSARVGLADRTTFRLGNALALPFDNAAFDVVWTEHTQMNIADKDGFYREIARVLKPGGSFAFHDILAGPRRPLHFPVPWAADASISHLIAMDELGSLLVEAGFAPLRWEDKTDASIAFFRSVLQRTNGTGPPLGLHMLMGNEATDKFRNLLRNLEEGRLRVVQAVMQRVPSRQPAPLQ